MGVKVRQRDGAWWLDIDHKGKRKAKRVGTGREGERAARAVAEKIQTRLALGDELIFDDAPTLTFEEAARPLPARRQRSALTHRSVHGR